MKNEQKNKRGFTLIELLVVISIIGILSSIVLTSLNLGRKKARDAVRKSDLTQIHKALEVYYADHNEQYPSEDWCDSSVGSCGAACPCGGSDWTYSGSLIAQVLRTHGYFQNLPKDPVNNTTYYYYYEPECNQGACIGRGCCRYVIGGRLEGGGSFLINSLGK